MQARSDKGLALHLLGKYDDAVVSFMESVSSIFLDEIILEISMDQEEPKVS
jgi:hypothetical protein